MVATMELAALLDSDLSHRGGRPFVAGTRVSVSRIGVLYSSGQTPEQIATDIDLTLAQVYAALAYYLANREAVDADIASEDAETLRIAATWSNARAQD